MTILTEIERGNLLFYLDMLEQAEIEQADDQVRECEREIKKILE